MQKIIMLGTGNGVAMDLYNTCFVIQNEIGNFLVDTGGSIELIKRLNQVNIDYKTIHHIFLSHSHTDHILGLIWLFRKISLDIKMGETIEPINIYCNDVVYNSIKEVLKYFFPSKFIDLIDNLVNYIVLDDGDKYSITGIEYTFFDVKAKSTKQFGFECILNNKKFSFLPDETLTPVLYDRFKNFDYVMHEAFCLDSEEKIYHAFLKNHSTTRNVCEVMNELGIKNLILYHTEESHKERRKELYTKEAQEYFNGNVIVPNDLEIIEIN